MVNQQLLDYIHQQLLAGITKEAITAAALTAGWAAEDLKEAFSAIEHSYTTAISQQSVALQTTAAPATMPEVSPQAAIQSIVLFVKILLGIGVPIGASVVVAYFFAHTPLDLAAIYPNASFLFQYVIPAFLIIGIMLFVISSGTFKPFSISFVLSCFSGSCLLTLFFWALFSSNLIHSAALWLLPLILSLIVGAVAQVMWYMVRRAEVWQKESITNVSHNLLTPLGRIKYAADALSGELAKLPVSEKGSAEELSQHIIDDTNRLIRGTTLLLDYSHLLDQGRIATFGVTDTSKVIATVVENFRYLLLAKNISFTMRLPEGRLPRVAMDELFLRTVLEVLLDNAVKYTPVGGKIIFSVSGEATTRRLIFSLADSGIGISPESLPAIFEQFYKPQQAERIRDSGMGLGLTVSKDIIERHGGSIWATSPGSGRGSVFSFSLPLLKSIDTSEFLKRVKKGNPEVATPSSGEGIE